MKTTLAFASAAVLDPMVVTAYGDNQLVAPYDFKVKFDSDKAQVIMSWTIKDGTYMGIGFGDVTKKGTDMLMCAVNEPGVAECFDMHSVWVNMATPP